MKRVHDDKTVTALRAASKALVELAKHPAFEGDAPEFNQGGIGYEAVGKVRGALALLEALA
jgi:hypothetical protein